MLGKLLRENAREGFPEEGDALTEKMSQKTHCFHILVFTLQFPSALTHYYVSVFALSSKQQSDNLTGTDQQASSKLNEPK